jgi:hypothetical protein
VSDNDPVATDIARHIAALVDQRHRLTDDGGILFEASANGDFIHVTTEAFGQRDAWVLTVEWDGER